MDATSLEGMKKVANRFSARRGTLPWWNEIKEPRTVATAQNFVNSITNNPFHSHLKKKKLPFLQNWESDWLPSWERKVKTSDCCQYTKSKPVWYWKRSLCFLAPRSALVCFSFGSLRAVKSSFFLKNSSQSSDTMVFAWFPRRWDALRKVHSVKVTHKMRLVMQGQQSWQHLDNKWTPDPLHQWVFACLKYKKKSLKKICWTWREGNNRVVTLLLHFRITHCSWLNVTALPILHWH